MAPPRHVAAPPKGSISVGWLCVSFLNITSHSCSDPSTSTFTIMLAAFISSLSSKSASLPALRKARIPISATSIRQTDFPRSLSFNSSRVPKYSFQEALAGALNAPSANSTFSRRVKKVVWRQWSLQYVSKTLISVIDGSRPTEAKWSRQKARSATDIARDILACSTAICSSSIFINPTILATSGGVFDARSRVLGFSNDASLLSTAFIRYFFILSTSASDSSPLKTNTRAHATLGRLRATICMHCSAESARWSNCPGKYSIAKTMSVSENGNDSSYKVSTGASQKMRFLTPSYWESSNPSTS